jgi:hypothetical protein
MTHTKTSYANIPLEFAYLIGCNETKELTIVDSRDESDVFLRLQQNKAGPAMFAAYHD